MGPMDTICHMSTIYPLVNQHDLIEISHFPVLIALCVCSPDKKHKNLRSFLQKKQGFNTYPKDFQQTTHIKNSQKMKNNKKSALNRHKLADLGGRKR